MIRQFILAAGLLLAVSSVQAQVPPAATMPAEIAADATRCESCHGGGLADAPRLNGQRPDYILLRLKAFHAPAGQTANATKFMFDNASSLDAAKAAAVADYFARLEPTPPRGGGPLGEKGRRLYQASSAGVPSCESCHGVVGDGGDWGPAPRLAGQHNLYLSRQLSSLSLSVRVHPQMGSRARALSQDDIAALVAYLGGDQTALK
jgi:cytochrome c553